jgi:hypothetical protein
LLTHIGAYIAKVAGDRLPKSEQATAIVRLGEMLYWNTWETIGESEANRLKQWAEPVIAALSRISPLAYGDGRLAPHEWLRTPVGQLIKADATGHSVDHTIIGRQSVAWDLAGAIVEWSLGSAATATLLKGFRNAGGQYLEGETFTFYQLAYAAFRTGLSTMCANMSANDPVEQDRLWRAYESYRAKLATTLSLLSLPT